MDITTNLRPVIAVQILLMLLLIVVGPIVDLIATRGLKRQPSSAMKIRYYQAGIASQWVCAALACWSVGVGTCFRLNAKAQDARWLLSHTPLKIAVGLLLATVFFYSFLPAIKSMRTGTISLRLTRYLQHLSFFLPQTPAERQWFAFLCVTAGVCEEILFRGFLFHAISIWPLQLGLSAALLLSSIIYGFNHLYQGLAGAVNTSVTGALFSLLFLLTRNLVLSILLHVAVDLQVLILLAQVSVDPATNAGGLGDSKLGRVSD